MRIPTGNFGNVLPNVQRTPTVGGEFAGAPGAAMARFGATGMQIAGQLMADQQRKQEEDERTQAGMAILKHQEAIDDELTAMQERLATGELSRADAPKAFGDALGKIRTETMKNIPEWLKNPSTVRLESAEMKAVKGLTHQLDSQRRQENAGNLEYIANAMSKQAGMPGADVGRINTEFEAAARALAPQAGLNPAQLGKTLDNFRDNNWYRQAQQRVIQASGDMGALRDLEEQLKGQDGFYADKLDPDKRLALQSNVISHRLRLESRIQHNDERREAVAERTVAKIDQQIASGVPASPDLWAQWADATRGTSQEAAFRDRIQSEEQVQRLLREPPEKQLAYIREREADLLRNGDPTGRETANLNRLRNAMEKTTKQLQESPLLFAQARTGVPVKPLDLTALLDENRAGEVGNVIAERVANVSALRRQYGDSVRPRVLLPNEAEALTRTLDQLGPDQQVEIFRALRLAINDETSYVGTLGQIAPDSPVKALAGTLAARGIDLVQSHWFSADETISARQTARLALTGESLLNPTKGMKATDGSTKTWIMPSKNSMLARFTDKIGDAFAGTPQAMDAQFELVQATYAGLMASKGGLKRPNVLDSELFDEAFRRTTPVMKQGGVSFLKPVIGMTDEQFREKLRDALPAELRPQYDRLPLRNVRANQYVISNGARPVLDANGAPLIVTVQP